MGPLKTKDVRGRRYVLATKDEATDLGRLAIESTQGNRETAASWKALYGGKKVKEL